MIGAVALRSDALADRSVLLASAGAAAGGSALGAGLARLGATAHRVAGPTAVPTAPRADLLVVGVPEPDPAAGTETFADPPTRAFEYARAGRELFAGASGGIVYLLPAGAGAAAETVAAAVLSLARTLAREWGPEGVRVNCLRAAPQPPALLVAELVGLLATPAGSMLTGQLFDLRAAAPAGALTPGE